MGNFIGMVYSQLKEAGVDTSDMDTNQAIDKWNAMQEKEGKFGSDKPTDAESKRMKEMGIEDDKIKDENNLDDKELRNRNENTNNINFKVNREDIKGSDSVSSLIEKQVKQQYPNAKFHRDNFMRDIYTINGEEYKIGENANFGNLYLEKVNTEKKNDNLDNNEYKNYKSEKEQTLKNEGYDVENMSDKEKNLAYSKLEKPSTQNAEQERMQELGIKTFFNVDNIEDLVKERVGTTTNWKETGYINVDGSQIDLSGKREGARPGSRSVDHRDVFEPEEYDSDNNTGSDALINYVNRGNIRVIPEYPGIEINENQEPTQEQYKAIANMVASIGRNGIGIDFANNKGDVGDNTIQYDDYVSPQRVVEDIKYFFKTGKIEQY